MQIKGLKADVTPATQYATVYFNDKPVATLQRARVYSKEPNWRLFDTAGIEIGNGFKWAADGLRLLARIREGV